MFIDIRELEEEEQARDSQFERGRDIRRGYVIALNGSIEGDRKGLVWFQALDDESQPFQVLFDGPKERLSTNLLYLIERVPKDPERWQIRKANKDFYFEDQQTYEDLPRAGEAPAKEDYEWPPGYPGALALNVFPRAVVDFAVRPTAPDSMKVRVYSGIYPGNSNYERFEGPINTADLTSRIPGTAGLARLVAISIDASGTLQYTNGSTFVDGLPMPLAALPDVPIRQLLISAVRLVNGMTAIAESNFDLEMRPLFGPGGLSNSKSGMVRDNLPANESLTIPDEYQYIVWGSYTINSGATLTVDGYLVII